MITEELLKYQKLDIGRSEILNELNASEERSAFASAVGTLQARFGELGKAVEMMKAVRERMEKLIAAFAEKSEGIEAFNEDFESFESDEDFANYETDYSKFERELLDINKEIRQCVDRRYQVKNARERIHADVKNASEGLGRKQKAFVDALNGAKERVRPIAAEMSELRKRIDPEAMRRYEALKSSGKNLPVVAIYVAGCCMGCGMNIRDDLRGGDPDKGEYAECPYCGRMLYKKQG